MRQTVKTIFAVLMLIAATFTFSACEQDSPENVHSTSELAGAWTWRTEQGDAGTCDVSISTINNSIVIQNFQNQGSSEAITAEVKGDAFDFNGSLANGFYEISEGHGTILSNWTVIKISYTISDGNNNEKIVATLTKTDIAAKK